MSWDKLPAKASLKPKPFEAHVSDEELNDFKQLLKLSKIGPKTYENQRTDRYFGISREWLEKAKAHWETKYDWYI
jgi:microsomal epoxide hydrolase